MKKLILFVVLVLILALKSQAANAPLAGNNVWTGTSNYFVGRLSAGNFALDFNSGTFTDTMSFDANGSQGSFQMVDGAFGNLCWDYVSGAGFDFFYATQADGVTAGGPDAFSGEATTLEFNSIKNQKRLQIGTNDTLVKGLALPVRYVNGNFTISVDDNTTYEFSNNATITLPTAFDPQNGDSTSYLPGHIYTITFITNGSCTLNSTSNQSIGTGGMTNYILNGAGSSITIQSTGTNVWNILGFVNPNAQTVGNQTITTNLTITNGTVDTRYLSFKTLQGTTLVVTNTAGIGTGGTATLDANGNDNRGVITLVAGGSGTTANSKVCTVLFSVSKPVVDEVIPLTPMSSAGITDNSRLFITNITTAGFEIWAGSVGLSTSSTGLISYGPCVQ